MIPNRTSSAAVQTINTKTCGSCNLMQLELKALRDTIDANLKAERTRIRAQDAERMDELRKSGHNMHREKKVIEVQFNNHKDLTNLKIERMENKIADLTSQNSDLENFYKSSKAYAKMTEMLLEKEKDEHVLLKTQYKKLRRVVQHKTEELEEYKVQVSSFDTSSSQPGGVFGCVWSLLKATSLWIALILYAFSFLLMVPYFAIISLMPRIDHWTVVQHSQAVDRLLGS